MPEPVGVMIIGGKVAGCSPAYHRTQIGLTDPVRLEQLTYGATRHAAGLVGQLRATRDLTELAHYNADPCNERIRT